MRRAVAATLGLALLHAPPAPAADSLEFPVKAAYLLKFAPFVAWPEGAFPSADSPFRLCVSGDDPFGPVLEEVAAGTAPAGHPVEIVRMQRVDGPSGCHVQYISGSAAQPVADALKRLEGAPVLTVTDASRDARTRGIVHFVVEENRVRFHIDEEAAARHRLTLSSKLLGIALSVRTRR